MPEKNDLWIKPQAAYDASNPETSQVEPAQPPIVTVHEVQPAEYRDGAIVTGRDPDVLFQEFMDYTFDQPTARQRLQSWVKSRHDQVRGVAQQMRVRRKPQTPEPIELESQKTKFQESGVRISTFVNPVTSVARYARALSGHMTSRLEQRADREKRLQPFSKRKILVGAMALTALSVTLFGLNTEDSSSAADAPEVAVSEVPSTTALANMSQTPVVPNSSMSPTTLYEGGSADVDVEQSYSLPSSDELAPVVGQSQTADAPEATSEAERAQIDIQAGDTVYNKVQDLIVGEHGARADNDAAVRALTDEIIKRIAEQNNTTTQRLSQVAIGQSMSVELSPGIARIRDEVQSHFMLFS